MSGSAAVQLHQLTPLRAPLAAPQRSVPAAQGGLHHHPPSPRLTRATAPGSGSCQGMETHRTGRLGRGVWVQGLHPEHWEGGGTTPQENEEWEPKKQQPRGGGSTRKTLRVSRSYFQLYFSPLRHSSPSALQPSSIPLRVPSSPHLRTAVLPLLTPTSTTPPNLS